MIRMKRADRRGARAGAARWATSSSSRATTRARWQAALDEAGYPEDAGAARARRGSRRAGAAARRRSPRAPAPCTAAGKAATTRSSAAPALRVRAAVAAARHAPTIDVLIAAWNVNSLNVRLPRLARRGSPRSRPDVICLQETKLEDAKFPALDVRARRATPRTSRAEDVQRRGAARARRAAGPAT